MKNRMWKLEQLLRMERWQSLQDAMARVTRLAIITVDHCGIPVTRHSAPRPFCQALRADPVLGCRCQKCDARGGLEAVRTHAPYIYLCHCGIVDIAIPIMVEGHYIGALMAGQIRQQDEDLEQIMLPSNGRLPGCPGLEEQYRAIPILPFREIQSIADMLFQLCSYVVSEAISRETFAELCRPPVAGAFLSAACSGGAPEQARTPDESSPPPPAGARPPCRNALLKPALDYIYENRGELITQKQMAELCHLSTSYFSRLFARVIGERFTTFLARQKVEWSKRLLERPELSVSQISDQLGFSSSGYYIKTFKKFEYVTPAVYRRLYITHTAEAD